MPCNAKNTPPTQPVWKTPPTVARESQSVFSNLGSDFWQDIENDGLTMIHSISPLRGCKTPNSNADLQNPSHKKSWKRRRLLMTDEPVPSGDRNPDEKNTSKDVIVLDNSASVERHKGTRKRRRHRRKSSLMHKGTPVLVSIQEDATEIVENIDGESSVKPISNSQEQVFENSTLDCVDPLKACVDPLDTGQKRVMKEVAATKAKRLKKNSGRKKGRESAGHSQNNHSRKTKGGSTSGNTEAPVDSSTPVGVLSTEHFAAPQRTSTDLDKFETPKSSRRQQISTVTIKKQKSNWNTSASGKSLEEADVMVQSTSKHPQGVEGVGVLHPQQLHEMPSPADLSLNITLADLLEELSSSKRSRLSTRLAKAKIACHEEKRQRRISLKRKHQESIGELDVTPRKMSQPKDDLHTGKSQEINLSASLTNPSEIHTCSISDESLVEKHSQTQSKVPHVQLEREVDINEAPVKNGSDFETPQQQRAGAGLTCTLCSWSLKCPPTMKTPSTASEDIQTLGNVSRGVQISPVVLRPDNPESEHTKTSTHSPLNSQSCQIDSHETQTQTTHETASFASQIPPEDCSSSIPPPDQTEEPRKASATEIKSFFESLLLVPTRSKSPPKTTPLLRRQSHRRRSKFSGSSDSARRTDSIFSQSSSEEAATLKSHCLSPVLQLVKPPPAPGETLPKGLPLNFMKFSMHCGRRSIGKRQTRTPQELFSSSGDSDSDVGRARAAAQRFIDMTEGRDSDDGLGDRGVDGENVVASQQVHRRKYRQFLDDSDSGSDGVDLVDGTDSVDGEERSSQGVFEDGGGGDYSNEHSDVEDYNDDDETRAQQVDISDEEDNGLSIVEISGSDDGGEGGDSSSNDIQEEWSEELDDDEEDYGNVFILDQATESKLKDDPESDGYSDANDSDLTDESLSENLIEGDIMRDRQQRQTTDNKFYARRLSPRKNRRRILDGLFSSSEESSSIDGRATELAQGEINMSEGSMPDHLQVSVSETVVARQLLHRKNIRDVLNDTSSSGNSTDVDTDHNSLDEDSQENVLKKQVRSNSFPGDDESKSAEQLKLKDRLKPTGLLTVKGKMLKIFKEQAKRKMLANTCSTKGKQTKSMDFKQRDIETSRHMIASKDKQQEPNGEAAKSTDRDEIDHRDGADHDGEVSRRDASAECQDEREKRTDEDDLDNDENVGGHVRVNIDERDVLKGDTKDIGGSDSDDTSLNIPDYGSSDDCPSLNIPHYGSSDDCPSLNILDYMYGSSDDCPEIYDGLLKKSKSQRKKQLEKTGSLDVKRKISKTHKQTSDGKQTKSRNVKKKCDKTKHQRSAYKEHRKESRNKKRGNPNRSGKASDASSDASSDKNNVVQDDVLHDEDDEDVDGQINNDRTEGGGIKDIDEDIGGSDSDDTIMNFTDDECRGVAGGSSVMEQATKASQSKEVTKAGLLSGRKSAKRAKSKKSLNLTESSEYDPDNNNGPLKKRRAKRSPKLAGLVSEERTVKNRRATKGKQTKLRNTKENGKTDHQHKTSVEQYGEPRSNEKVLNGCDQDLDDDENEDKDDAILKLSEGGSHGDKSQTSSLRQHKKVTQLKTKTNTKEGLLKERKTPQRKKYKKRLDQTERKQNCPRNHEGLLDKSKSHKKLAQKTLPEMADMRKSKKRPVQTETTEKNLHLDNCNERLNNGKLIKSRKQKAPLEFADKGESPKLLKQLAERNKKKDKQTKSRYSKKEDAGSTDREGDVGIIGKTSISKKSTKSKKAKPEKAVKGESMKERKSRRKSDFRKSIKTIEPTEVVAELMNERKSTKKRKQLSTGGKSVDKEHGGTCSKNSSLTLSTKFTKLKSKNDTKEGQSKESKAPKTTKSKKNLVWTKLMNSNGSSGRSNEKSDGDSDNSDYYIEALDTVLSGKNQDKREDDWFDDGSSDDESLGGNLMDDEDKDREGNATSDGDKYLREADDNRINGSHCEDVGHDGKIVSVRGMKKKLQIGGNGVRSSTDEKGGDVQEHRVEGDASKDDDEGVNGFDGDDSSHPLTGEGSSDVSCNDRSKEAARGSRNSSRTDEEVLGDEHSFSSEEVSDDQTITSSFLDEGQSSDSQRNACPFDHMGKSYRGKKRGCTCMIGNSPRRGKMRRKTVRNPVLTGSEDLDLEVVNDKPVRTRLRGPPTVNGLLKDKGKMLELFKQEAARKMMENNPATDGKLEACKTSCNFGEMNHNNFNLIMYTIKSDANRAICESLITPMPQEWEEPTISSKDREDHQSVLRSIFFELLVERGRKNRIAARRLGKMKINRGPTVKELKKANTAEKRRLKQLEAEVKSDGWIEYDMLPAVYPEIDETDFIKEIK